MDHRLFAVLAIVCFALGGAGCASQSQIDDREEILMPRQTGSLLQRRVMVSREGPTKKPKNKKESKPSTAKPTPKPKAEPTPELTPKPKAEPTPEPTPEPSPTPEAETTPDRFR